MPEYRLVCRCCGRAFYDRSPTVTCCEPCWSEADKAEVEQPTITTQKEERKEK